MSQSPEPDPEALHEVVATVERLRTIVARAGGSLETAVGWPASQLAVVEAVADGARSLSDVAAATDTHLSTTSRVVDGAVSDGLLQRATDPRDRRAMRLSLTRAGTRMLDDLAAWRHEQLRAGLRALPVDRRRLFADLLEQFVDGLAAELDPPPS